MLAAPDQTTWFGRRDHALFVVAVPCKQACAYPSNDVTLGTRAHVRCMGKVRKERCTPLTKTTVAVLKAWLAEPARRSTEMLFPNASGGRLTGDSVGDLLDKHVAVAGHTCPPRRKKRATPHALHHYLSFLTMSSDTEQRSAQLQRFNSQRGYTERIARHSLLDSTGC